MVRVLASLVAVTVAVVGVAPAPQRAAALVSGYVPPVRPPAAVVTDHFRPPPTPYAAGNRGLDYAVVPGTVVVASASGVVVFAGPVAGSLHVTIAHPDGLRTSYSFLARVLVTRGEPVRQGQAVGVAGAIFHFGVRDAAGTYLDPERLFAGRIGAHLVPGPDDGANPLPDGSNGERAALAEVVRGWIFRAGGPTAARAFEELSLLPSVSAATLTGELAELARSQQRCTPDDARVPVPTRRRIAVLVGGLGSTGTTAAVERVDTDALGYRPDDVLRFSYAG
ncbi:MAG TPA: peptidoglycan DD-metalloendopeptidase family protein, partial [Acidimicrobiales bacterium]|nr:peptidoglycan DD-metalloendopeptidase family protein [Acidimicrobiales bacterium]